MIEHIKSGAVTLASIIRAALTCEQTTFLTPPDAQHQVGLIVRQPGGEVAAHTHRPIERHLSGTSEVLVVREGLCDLDVFDEWGNHVASRRLWPGDVALLLAGGHGLRMHTRTVLMEIKQGPFTGQDEKVLLLQRAEAA